MIHTGTVMEIGKSRSYVFTSGCDMVSLKTKKEYMLGQQVTFSDRDICRKKPAMMVGIAAAALLVIAAAAVFLSNLRWKAPFFDSSCVAIVSVDINPSIEISVNKDQKIIDAVSYNSEGAEILGELSLKSKPVEEGVDSIVGAAKAKGYLNSGNKVVLVSAALFSPEDGSSETDRERLIEVLSALENRSEEADILTVFIDDPDIIGDAKQSNITIGKELLYKYALEQGLTLSLDEVRAGSIGDLLDRLNASSDASGTLVLDREELSAGPIPDFTGFASEVTVKQTDNGLAVQWNQAPESEGFRFYKVVASLHNSNPVYPEDGYALVIQEIGKTSAVLSPGCDYHGGDVGGTLLGGQTYYISISYVYENTVFKGNAVSAIIPEPVAQTPEQTPTIALTPTPQTPEPQATQAVQTPQTTTQPTPSVSAFTPSLTVETSNGKLVFNWTPISGDPVSYGGKTYKTFKYYKVVASQTNPNPIYPDDGYLQAISNKNTSNWTVDPSGDGYHTSPKLESGKSYYFSVTYVFENGKFTSNTAGASVPAYTAEPVQTAPVFSSPTLSVSADGGMLTFSWTPVKEKTITYSGVTYQNFTYCKVVASQSNPNPVYPTDGYLYYISDPGASRWSLNPSTDPYNKSPVLEPGKTYYFSVTYVFENGKFSSNAVTATVPGSPTEPVIPSISAPLLSVSANGTALVFSFTPVGADTVSLNGVTYSGFHYCKIVASKTNPNPVYPDDGYLYYTSELTASYWSVEPGSDSYNQSPVLESGSTYYFSVTYVFDNGKFSSNTVQLAVP